MSGTCLRPCAWRDRSCRALWRDVWAGLRCLARAGVAVSRFRFHEYSIPSAYSNVAQPSRTVRNLNRGSGQHVFFCSLCVISSAAMSFAMQSHGKCTTIIFSRSSSRVRGGGATFDSRNWQIKQLMLLIEAKLAGHFHMYVTRFRRTKMWRNPFCRREVPMKLKMYRGNRGRRNLDMTSTLCCSPSWYPRIGGLRSS